MQSVIIGPNQAGQRLDKFLNKHLPQASSSFLYKMLRKKNIVLNGKRAEGKEILKEGDEVNLFFAEDTYSKFMGKVPAEKNVLSSNSLQKHFSSLEDQKIAEYKTAFGKLKNITVIYEDEHVLILNKPSGILTQKASITDISLNEWMIGYLLYKKCITESELHSFKPSVCNRLDRNTSGLVLCGKSLAGSQALSKMIRDRALRKYYRTIVVGSIQSGQKIEGYLIKDEHTNKVRVLDRLTFAETVIDNLPLQKNTKDAALIQTSYKPVILLGNKYTYLEVELITGKTHQIRAHLSSIGHPIVGDKKYGNCENNEIAKNGLHLPWQLLHAYRLEFPVITGTLSKLSEMTVTAPLPKLFDKILKDYNAEVR